MNAAVAYPPINPDLEPWISATQISTFELCNRKWAWRWLERIHAPPSKFAQLGIDTHDELENWLKWGRVPEGNSKQALLAQAIIPYLPPPQAVDYAQNRNVERDELIIVEDVLFISKIDLFMPWQVSWDGATRPRTYDHKTTSDFRWCPRPSEIQYDPQAALYAAWTIIKTQQTTIDLQWNYVRTKGAIKVEPICATVTDEMITPRMQANIATGREIKKHLFQTKRALDVIHDPRACDEYGGCPYRERCGISPKERIVSIMSDFKHQPATQQFLQGVGPTNGSQVNPPQFPPQPQAQPQFQVPAGQQFAAPMPSPYQGPPAFQVPGQAPGPQPSFQSQPQQSAPQFAPQQQPAFQAQQPAFQAPPQIQPQQQPAFVPQAPQQMPPQQQFAPPQPPSVPAPEPAKREVGRPKSSKEYDMTGAWVSFMNSAIQLTGGNIPQAAQLADQAIVELKARQ